MMNAASRDVLDVLVGQVDDVDVVHADALDAEALQRDHGIAEIPHGLPQRTYELLLQGTPIAQHPPAPGTGRQHRPY